MPSRNTYCLTWVSLTLDEGYLLTAAPPELGHGVAPLGPLLPAQDNGIRVYLFTQMEQLKYSEVYKI